MENKILKLLKKIDLIQVTIVRKYIYIYKYKLVIKRIEILNFLQTKNIKKQKTKKKVCMIFLINNQK